MSFTFCRSGIHDKNTNRDIDEQVTDSNFIIAHECIHGMLLLLCSTLCSPKDCSLPGSSVQEILQARTLEWVAMSSSRGSS